MNRIVLAGSGHRPSKLGGYGEKPFKILVELATEQLEQIKPIQVISGMALGWDQALAVAALEMNFTLIAAVPFQGQELKWPQHAQRLYHGMLEQAANVVIVSTGGYSAEKLNLRNHWMVDRCNLLLAVCDGSPSGTQNCIEYARGQQKTIVNCYDSWQKLSTIQ